MAGMGNSCGFVPWPRDRGHIGGPTLHERGVSMAKMIWVINAVVDSSDIDRIGVEDRVSKVPVP